MAHITEVRLKAFKSVSGGWQEFQFDRGLNAIVGPNGCGKSSLLDGLCFAFAAPPRTFAAASLADLANSDSSEVCEVVVSLRSSDGEVHSVAAALTADGGRTFKVNDRVKTGKEVRDFLRSLGICLDSGAAVIKQAQVTRLADANAPADLAALVAESSGLGRWNEEVAAAAEELKRTRHALADVQASLLSLERGVAASEEQVKAAERHEQLEHEAATVVQQLAEALQAAASAATAAANDGAAAAEAAERCAEEAKQGLDDALAALAAAQAEAAAAEHSNGHAVGDAALLAWQQRLAAAEEEVRLLAARQHRWIELDAAVQQEQAVVARLMAARERAAAEAAAARQAQRQLAVDVLLAESAASAHSLVTSVETEVQQLQAALASSERAAAAAAGAGKGSEERLAEVRRECRRAAQVLQTAQDAASKYDQPAAAQAGMQRQQFKLAQLRQRESQLAQEAGTLAARLGGAFGAGWRPLHACFTFVDSEVAQRHATALQVLAGGTLAVVVADSLHAAGHLLEGGGGQRIWPLDSLWADDPTQRQRKAAQAFSAGQVVLPCDLLRFEPRFHPAILRAFGSRVLAANDAVAEQLITRFGIPSITPDGKVTSHGTLQGGWRGNDTASVGAATPMHLKISLSAAEEQLAMVRQELPAAQAPLVEAQRQAQAAQEAAANVEAAAADLTAAEAELHACEAQLAAHHAADTDVQAALGRARLELAAKRQLLSSLAISSGGGHATESALAALHTEQRRLVDLAASLETGAASAACELAAAANRLAAAEDALALAAMPSRWEEQLAGQRTEAATAVEALEARRAELAHASEAVAAKQLAAEAAGAEVSAAGQRLAEAEGGAASLQSASQHLAADRSELEVQLEALLKEVPELRLVLPAAPSAAAPSGDPPVAMLRQKCTQLVRQRQRVLAEQRSNTAARLPLAEQLRMRDQRAALVAARQQAATLATAAQCLQDGIHSSNPQVLAANEAVFEAVATTFTSLAAAVLPAYCVRLRKVGSAVHEGVQLQFAHHAHTAAGPESSERETAVDDGSSGEAASWRSGLDVLSGGQRTMVSLAFVVAVAMAGGSTSLFLMDEVDAALDETNQHLVARLFDCLSASSAVACSQVLCVSHNAAFQLLCSRVVQLTRGAAGTMPAAVGSKGGGTKAHAPAGRSKKSRIA